MGADSLVLALKSTFDPAKAYGLAGSYQLTLSEIPFKIAVKEGRFEAERGEADGPDATIRSVPARSHRCLRRKPAGEGGGGRGR